MLSSLGCHSSLVVTALKDSQPGEGLCLLGLPSPGATPAVPRAFVPPPVGAWSKVGKCFLSVRIRWAG